jgi:hypothetical protein
MLIKKIKIIKLNSLPAQYKKKLTNNFERKKTIRENIVAIYSIL